MHQHDVVAGRTGAEDRLAPGHRPVADEAPQVIGIRRRELAQEGDISAGHHR
jgi:hypothetical protein